MHNFSNLHRVIISAFAILITCNTIQAQVPRAKGLVFDATHYKKESKRGKADQQNGVLMPVKVSLRPFCPTPQDQGAEPSCTAWAITYGAITIQKAIQRKLNNTNDINKIACSKSFVFNQLVRKDPKYIPTIEETLRFLKSKGTCLAATFSNQEPITQQPDDLAIDEAQNYRLIGSKEVFDPDTTMAEQIKRLKRLLSDSVPVIVGMRLPLSFSNTVDTFKYNDEEPLDSSAHAMCLIGFDDKSKSFELMNSWGTTWGDKGFVRMSYKDVIRLMCCAYQVTPYFKIVDENSSILRGEIFLNLNSEKAASFSEARVQYDDVNKHYRTIKPNLAVGSGFQLALRHIPLGWQVNVININKDGEVSIFDTSQIDSKLVEKIIPNDNTQYIIEEKGTEWLCIVCTKAPLSNLKESLQKSIKSNPKAIQEEVYLLFKDYLINDEYIHKKRIGFSIPVSSMPKGAVLLLKLETQ